MNFSAQKHLESFPDVPFPGEAGWEEYEHAAEAAEVERKTLAEEAAAARAAEAERNRKWRAEHPPRVVTQAEVDELIRRDRLSEPPRLDAQPELWPREARTEAKRPTAPAVIFKDVAAFCGEYAPLAYTIEGIVRSGSLYTLTGKTGDGKTGFNVVMALTVVHGPKRHSPARGHPGQGLLHRP
jgi:hypothetical protein